MKSERPTPTNEKPSAPDNAHDITPASGATLEKLQELQEHAFELIKVAELEISGIRDGDGYWHGSDALEGYVEHIASAYIAVKQARHEENRADDHFGLCPICHKTDGIRNFYKAHFGICEEHGLYWSVGSNLLSSWQHETEADWQRNAKMFDEMRPCEPFHWPTNSDAFVSCDPDSIPF